MMKMTNKKTLSANNREDLIFYILMLALPILQFIIFYIGVNGNSILLSFKSYDRVTGAYQWVYFDNIRLALHDLLNSSILVTASINSLIIFSVGLVVGVPLALMFSFYIAKKMFGYRLFKLLLFLPSVISAIVMTLIFGYFGERAIPEIVYKLFDINIMGLFSSPDTAFKTVLIYNILLSFGVAVLIYASSMSSISTSVIESVQLEGAKYFQEFWYISLPMIYPTIVMFLTVGVAGLFINQANVFSLFGSYAPEGLYTLGYYLYVKTASAGIAEYAYISSLGLILTIIAIPLTFLIKFTLEHLGPSNN